MTPITIGIAGSTVHTLMCAKALAEDTRFAIQWVLTPTPKSIGRKQLLTKNPLHLWAEESSLPVVLIEKKIDQNIQTKIEDLPSVDILLVVDFGYLVPKWLLDLPNLAPVNVHPSLLPRWRGSSPGQFVLLYGETSSAVTIMVMGEGLDTGPVIQQLRLAVEPTWNAAEYYQAAFLLAQQELGNTLADFAAGQIQPRPQPEESPTRIAKRFSREDGFVAWSLIQAVQKGENITAEIVGNTSALLQDVAKDSGVGWPVVLSQAVRGLSPWPGLWTQKSVNGKDVRVKILAVEILSETKLNVTEIQTEGEKAKKVTQLF